MLFVCGYTTASLWNIAKPNFKDTGLEAWTWKALGTASWALPKEQAGLKPAALLGLESRLLRPTDCPFAMQKLVDEVKQVRLNVTLCTIAC